MKKRILILSSILLICLSLGIIGLTYSFFSGFVLGNDITGFSVVESGVLSLTYEDTEEIFLPNAIPGTSVSKILTVTNTGNVHTNYTIFWKELYNDIINNELTYSLECVSYQNYGKSNQKEVGSCESIFDEPIGTSASIIKENIYIKAGYTHAYNFTISFVETGENQNYNQGKQFSGTINIKEFSTFMSAYSISNFLGVGDYVNYDSGSFTQTVPTPASSTYSVFSGKTEGRRRDVGIDCVNSLALTGDQFNGWRVLNIIDGEVKLITAGTPECYKNSWNGALDLNNLISHDYSEYINNTFATSATVLDKTLAETVEGASIVYDGFVSEATPVLRAGARYFFATISSFNAQHLFYTQPTGYIGSAGGQNYGIRPVVTLKNNLYLGAGNGTKSNPYEISTTFIEEEKVNQNGFLTGYWENWNNVFNLKVRNIPITYNIVALSFGIQLSGDPNGKVSFSLDSYLKSNLNYTEEEFKNDIKILKYKGQKVIVSLGGASGNIIVDDEASKNNFVSSVKNIINTYNLDGIDINLENSINPTYLGQAINEISDYYDEDFIITMAPETVDIKSDINGNISGKYYELLQLIKDKVTIVNMQLYNTGTQYGLDGNYYTPGTVDFITAYIDVMKKAGLDESQIGLGMNANNTKTGYVDPSITNNAILSARLGGQTIGGSYVLNTAYPRIGGIMLYSINQDGSVGYNFSNTYRTVLK